MVVTQNMFEPWPVNIYHHEYRGYKRGVFSVNHNETSTM